MNWGQKLTGVFIVFAAGMSYLAYRCMHINTDLVTKEYYKQELRYQDVIDGTKSANELGSTVKLIDQNGTITVQLPAEMKNEKIAGDIWFYCAADAKKDRHIPIAMNTGALQQIDKKIFFPGNYTVKLEWTSNHKHYYSEQPLIIL